MPHLIFSLFVIYKAYLLFVQKRTTRLLIMGCSWKNRIFLFLRRIKFVTIIVFALKTQYSELSGAKDNFTFNQNNLFITNIRWWKQIISIQSLKRFETLCSDSSSHYRDPLLRHFGSFLLHLGVYTFLHKRLSFHMAFARAVLNANVTCEH